MALLKKRKKYFIIENFNSECQKTELLLRCLFPLELSHPLAKINPSPALNLTILNIEQINSYRYN